MKNIDRTYHKKMKTKLSKEEKRALKLERKNKLGLNQIIKPIMFLIFSIVIELVNYHILNIQNTDGSNQLFPTYIFFDLGVWILIAGVMLTCTKTWLANLMFYFFTILQLLICLVNSVLYLQFGYFFTWDALALAFEGVDSMDSCFIDTTAILICSGIAVIILATGLVLDLVAKRKVFSLRKKLRPILLLVCFLCCSLIGSTCYSIQYITLATGTNSEYEEIESDKYLYSNMHISEEAYRKFGTCGFYVKNFYDLTLGKLFGESEEEIKAKISSQTISKNEDAVLFDQNLIILMLESYEWFAIDPYNTPNLYKLATGTISSNNTSSVPSKGTTIHNYISNNKTNVSEDLALLGYMPHVNQYNANEGSLATAYSLPNLFSSLGYTTNYFHNFKPSFYNRDNVSYDIGFDKFYSNEDFASSDGKGVDFNSFQLESKFIEQMLDKIAPTDKKFMSFYTTVATHGGYETYNSRFDELYDSYDSNLNNFSSWLTSNGYTFPTDEATQKQLRAYKVAAMDTDAMVGKLFDHLSETGLIDSTTVIVYSDHNAYFDNLSQKIKGTDVNDSGNLKTHNVPLMVYSSKLGSNDIYDFCNTYDLYPTICELFGLEYSTFFTQGYNIFSEDISNSMYVSYLTGYYSNSCYSKNMVNISLYDGSAENDIADFKTKVCEFYQKQKLIERVYRSNWKK